MIAPTRGFITTIDGNYFPIPSLHPLAALRTTLDMVLPLFWNSTATPIHSGCFPSSESGGRFCSGFDVGVKTPPGKIAQQQVYFPTLRSATNKERAPNFIRTKYLEPFVMKRSVRTQNYYEILLRFMHIGSIPDWM